MTNGSSSLIIARYQDYLRETRACCRHGKRIWLMNYVQVYFSCSLRFLDAKTGDLKKYACLTSDGKKTN